MEIENMSIEAIENFLEKKKIENKIFIGSYYNFEVNPDGIQLLYKDTNNQVGSRLFNSIPALKQAIEYLEKIKK